MPRLVRHHRTSFLCLVYLVCPVRLVPPNERLLLFSCTPMFDAGGVPRSLKLLLDEKSSSGVPEA